MLTICLYLCDIIKRLNYNAKLYPFDKTEYVLSRENIKRKADFKKMVKVENLVKRYGSNYALNDISFEIGEGEIVGLLGPNGAGKSTAMNILTGYLSSTSGSAYVNGINILDDPIAADRKSVV